MKKCLSKAEKLMLCQIHACQGYGIQMQWCASRPYLAAVLGCK